MSVDEILSALYDEIVRSVANLDVKNKVVPYFGGDYHIADLILDILNRFIANANIFVEVFGGSCYISQQVNIMRLHRGKPENVICNDKDKLLYKLYVVLRDRPRELAEKLAAWPYAREFYDIALALIDRCERDELDDLTCAALTYYILRSSITYGIKGSKGFLTTHGQGRRYVNAVAAIVKHAARLAGVVFECRDFAEIIPLYDREETTFYLDPPYVNISDTNYDEYRVRFTVRDLRRMAHLLRRVKGHWLLKIAVDNYRLIKDDLPPHQAMTHEVISNVEIGVEKRKKWQLVLAYA